MKLIVTIDTEEDDWGGFTASHFTTASIERLPRLQRLFDEFGVRPTYLTTYVVANDPKAATILREIHSAGTCEIGAHCHPWNTPPVREERNAYNSMLCNLPPELALEKIRALTELITRQFGVRPTAFRAGRWGYGKDVALTVTRLGYRVDTSITPFIDWSADHGPDYSSTPLAPYWTNLRQIYPDAPGEPLVEIPSTVGFLQKDFARAARMQRLLARRPFRTFKCAGILNRLGLLNRIWLCPEHHSAAELIRLTRRLQDAQFPFVNLMFHSTTLEPGLTPFVRSVRDEEAFRDRIRQYLDHAASAGLQFATLSEAARELPAELA